MKQPTRGELELLFSNYDDSLKGKQEIFKAVWNNAINLCSKSATTMQKSEPKSIKRKRELGIGGIPEPFGRVATVVNKRSITKLLIKP